MQLSRARPFARGVDQLMYVGDDGTDAAQPKDLVLISTTQLLAVAGAMAIAPKGKRLTAAAWMAGVSFGWNLLTGKFAV